MGRLADQVALVATPKPIMPVVTRRLIHKAATGGRELGEQKHTAIPTTATTGRGFMNRCCKRATVHFIACSAGLMPGRNLPKPNGSGWYSPTRSTLAFGGILAFQADAPVGGVDQQPPQAFAGQVAGGAHGGGEDAAGLAAARPGRSWSRRPASSGRSSGRPPACRWASSLSSTWPRTSGLLSPGSGSRTV